MVKLTAQFALIVSEGVVSFAGHAPDQVNCPEVWFSVIAFLAGGFALALRITERCVPPSTHTI